MSLLASAPRAGQLVTWAECYKTFMSVIFRDKLIVCQTKLEKLAHSGLLRKFIILGQKKFYNIDSNCQCYKTLFSWSLTMRQNKLECYSAVKFFFQKPYNKPQSSIHIKSLGKITYL
jgi:hypothetical protein